MKMTLTLGRALICAPFNTVIEGTTVSRVRTLPVAVQDNQDNGVGPAARGRPV